MPISFTVDSGRRCIVASVSGTVGEQDLVAYQKEIGSRPELSGFDEIFDASHVVGLLDINLAGLKKLANLAASMDVKGPPPRLAIVAGQDMMFGLGRMYEAFRETAPRANKQVAVFHSRPEADQWLESQDD